MTPALVLAWVLIIGFAAVLLSSQLLRKRKGPTSGNAPVQVWTSLSRVIGGFVSFACLTLLFLVWIAVHPARFDKITIRGSPKFKHQVMSALVLLKARMPEAYQMVTNYIGAIAEAKHSGMAAYLNPPTFHLNDTSAFYSRTWCAASIAHDSMHSKLYHEYLREHPEEKSVPAGVWMGEAVERRCSEYELKVLQKIGAPDYEVLWCSQTNNRYWEVEYDKRNW
jgi:hypothetical protein